MHYLWVARKQCGPQREACVIATLLTLKGAKSGHLRPVSFHFSGINSRRLQSGLWRLTACVRALLSTHVIPIACFSCQPQHAVGQLVCPSVCLLDLFHPDRFKMLISSDIGHFSERGCTQWLEALQLVKYMLTGTVYLWRSIEIIQGQQNVKIIIFTY